MCALSPLFFVFFFNDTATTEIYTLSLHDALPISITSIIAEVSNYANQQRLFYPDVNLRIDRKSTRLHSSHGSIPYAVFCLYKKSTRRNLTSGGMSIPVCGFLYIMSRRA